MDFAKLKLVIWDLDETLWHGTLSEGAVVLPEEHAQLLRDMVDTGVMCSICSKNEAAQVDAKLAEMGIAGLFVFCSVNWAPKGERVRQIIEEMNLRQPNVLFIDDNASNRGEVSHSCPEMAVEDVDIIASLIEYYRDAGKKDRAHSRLRQYQLLEQKRDFKASYPSNEAFLAESQIHVEFHTDCGNQLDRIAELVMRSNQLNFTKLRSSKQELASLLADAAVQTGYVSVRDRFGDYGIVGFYALADRKLIHFVFSCRVLGMGIEQYVYRKLGQPALEIVGEVSASVDAPEPYWIAEEAHGQADTAQMEIRKKLIIKGPCDMSQMFAYIRESANIVTEFVYVSDSGVSIEQGTTTTHIVNRLTLSQEERDVLCRAVPFGDSAMFDTAMFDGDVACIVLSTFADPNLGLYRCKKTGVRIAFGEYCNDLTDERLWPGFMDQTLFTANCRFTRASLEAFRNDFEYIGRIQPEEIVENLRVIYRNISQDAMLILVLGSETPYEANTQRAYQDRHLYNAKLNRLLREWAKDKPRVAFIDVNRHLEGQSSFTNNINHFTRNVYYRMSKDLVEIVNRDQGLNLRQNNQTYVYLRKNWMRLVNKLRKIVLRKS